VSVWLTSSQLVSNNTARRAVLCYRDTFDYPNWRQTF